MLFLRVFGMLALAPFFMENLKKQLTIVLATVVIAFLVIIISAVLLFQGKNFTIAQRQIESKNISPVKNKADNFSYKGENGKDALTILKEIADMRLDKSGMVASINGRSADSQKHEYWAFYINGKLADVGPADYKTKNSDTIEWRIDKY